MEEQTNQSSTKDRQTLIYRKLKIDQQEPGMNTVPAPVAWI